MQISTLIFAPAFFAAGNYVVLGRLIAIMGPQSSPLSAKWYLIIFCTCDLFSLVIQAIGGGMASAASNKPDGNTTPGTNVMVGGIIFQLVSMSFFVGFFLEFLRRSRKFRFTLKLKLMVGATTLSVALIFLRSIYRTIELLQGWHGYLITHERFFVGLDGVPMVLCVVVFNVLHPGWLLNEGRSSLTDVPDTDSAEEGAPEDFDEVKA